jgi:hypothetical protein
MLFFLENMLLNKMDDSKASWVENPTRGSAIQWQPDLIEHDEVTSSVNDMVSS